MSRKTTSNRKNSRSDGRSTTTKKTKITNFTYENVEEEIQLIMEEYGIWDIDIN